MNINRSVPQSIFYCADDFVNGTLNVNGVELDIAEAKELNKTIGAAIQRIAPKATTVRGPSPSTPTP